MIMAVILHLNDKLKNYLINNNDPSAYYLKHLLITPDRGYTPPEDPIYDMNIKYFYIGEIKDTRTNTRQDLKYDVVYKIENQMY